MDVDEQALPAAIAAVPDRCEACWAEAVGLSWSSVPVEDRYLRQLEIHREWPSEQRCGGIAVVGQTPPLCEPHMQPWGHRRSHSAALHASQFADDPILRPAGENTHV
jgi:hypothetical protein